MIEERNEQLKSKSIKNIIWQEISDRDVQIITAVNTFCNFSSKNKKNLPDLLVKGLRLSIQRKRFEEKYENFLNFDFSSNPNEIEKKRKRQKQEKPEYYNQITSQLVFLEYL